MTDRNELETLVYCLGQIGGKHNPVITSGSAFDSNYEYTTKGYARYIQEANNMIKFMHLILNYFLESVKSEFEEDPLAFIDSESEEDVKASIQKMKKQWKEMFKDYQKELSEVLRNKTLEESSSTPTPSVEESSNNPTPSIEESLNPTSRHADDEDSSEETSSSSAKIPRLDSETLAKTSEMKSEVNTPEEPEAASKAGTVGVPVESLEFPNIILQSLQRLKAFGRVLKAEYQELRARMGKALDRITPDHTAHDLKGFTLQKMEKFAKWKFSLKTLSHLVPELESNLNELDLDFAKRKANEKRLTDWLYFDDGKRDRKYHHRILIPVDLTVSVEEISAIIWRMIRRYRKIKQSLQNKLPEEHGAFDEKVDQWRYEVLYHMKKPVKLQKSDDTYYNLEDMPDDAV